MSHSLSLSSRLIGFPADYVTPTHSDNEEMDPTTTSSNSARSSRRSGATLATAKYPLFPTALSTTVVQLELKPTAISSIAPVNKLYDSKHVVATNRFTTSADCRGYIPVFEYFVNGFPIMLDSENGSVHFTGIYKCLGNKKMDVAALSADPMFSDSVRKIRGGSLRIQGTWLSYEAAIILSSRIAFEIRDDLIPLLGPDFPETCIKPGETRYGILSHASIPKTNSFAAPTSPVPPGPRRKSIIALPVAPLISPRVIPPLPCQPRRSWKWSANGGVGLGGSESTSRGRLNSIVPSRHTASPHSKTTPDSSPNSPRRYTPYPLKPISTPSLPEGPHVYSSSIQPQSTAITGTPYYRSISRAEYQRPLSTQLSATSQSRYSMNSTIATSLPITASYSFPSRMLPEPQQDQQLFYGQHGDVYGPGPFSRVEDINMNIEQKERSNRRPSLPSIRIVLESNISRRGSRVSSNEKDEDEMMGGEDDGEGNALGMTMSMNMDQVLVLAPIIRPLPVRPTLLPLITSTSTFMDTGSLARHILAQQQFNYNQKHLSDHRFRAQRRTTDQPPMTPLSHRGEGMHSPLPNHSTPPLFSLSRSPPPNIPQFLFPRRSSFPSSESRSESGE